MILLLTPVIAADYGETTDEEDVPATATTRPQSLLRNPWLSSVDPARSLFSVSERGTFRVPTIPASLRRGPRLGTFTPDPRKAVAVVDETGQNMVIYPAKRPAPVQTSLARVPSGHTTSAPPTPVTPHATLGTSPDLNDAEYTEMASHIPTDPVLSRGPNFSHAAMPPLPHNISPDAVQVNQSPLPHFYPSDSAEQSLAYYDEVVEDIDEGELLLNVEDFLDFGESSSDAGDGKETSPASPTFASESDSKTSFVPPPKTSPSSASSSQDLLKHFDTGIITAFRRGQPPTYGSQRPSMSTFALTLTAMKPTPPSHLLPFSAHSSNKRKLGENLAATPGYESASKRQMIGNR